MRKLRTQIPLLILWLMLSVFLWSWIFTFLTDTDRAHKIVVYADTQVSAGTELAVLLEKQAGEDIRMIRVFPFSHALMDETPLRQADVYLMGAAAAEERKDWLQPLSDTSPAEAYLTLDGLPYGIPAKRSASAYIRYTEENPMYFFLGAQSVHLEDGEALRTVYHLLEVEP